MLILEGSDLVGKTTFAKKALKIATEQFDLPSVYKHFGLLPKCWDYYSNYLPHITAYDICDRFVLSECMYSAILGREENISCVEGRLLQAHLDLKGSYTVVLTQPNDVLRERWREGEAFSLEKVLEINLAHFDVIGYTKWGLRVDKNLMSWTDDNVAEVVHEWIGNLIHTRTLLEEAKTLL